MNTKTKFSKEELYYNLPDYVSGKIEDRSLNAEIEKLMNTDPEFRNEYEDLKNTFHFLNTTELESPGDSYFNNLPVRINERISNENLSIRERSRLIWKILLPALAVLIVAIVLINMFKTDDNNIQVKTGSDYNKSLTQDKIPETSDKKNEQTTVTEQKNVVEQTDISQEKIEKQNISEDKTSRHRRWNTNNKTGNIKTESPSLNTENNNNFIPVVKDSKQDIPPARAIVDNIELTDFTGSEDEDDLLYINEDEDYEDEFMKLPPQEQKEILDILNKKQI